MRHCSTRYLLLACVVVVLFANPLPTSAQQPYDAGLVRQLAEAALKKGNPARGAVLYSSPTNACLSCHRVGEHGGNVGPELSKIAAEKKLEHLVESLLWPSREVAEPYRAIAVLTVDGRVVRGYRRSETDRRLLIQDSASGKELSLRLDEIEAISEIGTLMPDGLTAKLSRQDQLDLIAFLSELGRHGSLSPPAIDSLLAHAHGHHPENFEMPRAPLDPVLWPSWQAEVNRDRIYDFYAKQARHFRGVSPQPRLLAEYPGLDGGSYGHWGNQSEATWADGRWNDTALGSLLSGVFHGDGVTIPRGVCIRLEASSDGKAGDSMWSACFDPDTLTFPRVWKGGFVKFSEVRHGFLDGLIQDGDSVETSPQPVPYDRSLPKTYNGFYRAGPRVVFAYRVGDTEYLDAAKIIDGEFHRVIAPREDHPDRALLRGGPPQWPDVLETNIMPGKGTPYAVDKIELPHANPWRALLYCSGHDFLSDGTAIIATMQGDVWRGSGFHGEQHNVRWRRIASGLHQPLGVVVDQDQIFVIGRDQLTRLHDLNDDGEIDHYECFSRVLETSPSGHDFTCGLARDAANRFYTASGKQGLMRISADGTRADVLATGLRNSDGVGLHADGLVTVPSSEGDWTPASMIAAVRPGGPVLNRLEGEFTDRPAIAFFGRPGGNPSRPPDLPMLYLPRGLDNSSGGQVYIESDRWGPVQGEMVHLSFGAGCSFLLLRDEFDGWIQGAVIPIAGEFSSGVHRGAFHPIDGQLYVSGMAGWGSYTTDDGCFERVRYTGDDGRGGATQLPIGFHVHRNGIRIDFSEPLDQQAASVAESHFAQVWNYRYSGGYGSPEYSTRQLGLRGHDVLTIESATLLNDDRSLFLEIPDLQPVNQLHLLVQSSDAKSHDLFLTVHRLDEPMTRLPGYRPQEKVVLPHPILADLQRPAAAARNPHHKAIPDARPITIAAAKNLTFNKPELKVRGGEPIRMIFENPDAVPHNWVLLKPGSLRAVGELANRMIADPDAAARQYVPDSTDVLAFTDIVDPYSSTTIYFEAPSKPGRYPYLCSFPGHWMVMNGVMIVE